MSNDSAEQIPFDELNIDPYGGDREIPTDPIPLSDDEDDE
jgi:hypothetical protein